MANKFITRIQNTKARTLLLLGVFILIVLVAIIYFVTKKSTVLQTLESRTAKVPDIASIPGGVTSEKYQQLQEEENKRRAEAAKKAGTSAVATIIGSRGKDSLAGKETFGIEDQFLKTGGACKCPPTTAAVTAEGAIPDLDPALAAKLIAEIEADPSKAAALLKQHPGLGKAICQQKPELALKLAESDKEAAKVLLNECPDMARMLSEKNPELFKQLMLENPDLAKKLAARNPEIFKKLAEQDPAFMKKLMLANPDLAKILAEKDPSILQKLGEDDPAFMKSLMLANPDLAKIVAEKNPALLKKLMTDDPAFARQFAKNNPDVVKTLMKNDPDFVDKMAKANPDMVKDLMKGDPAFSAIIAKNNPGAVKELMLNDPEFARALAQQNPDAVKEMMSTDPEFAKKLAEKNPTLVKELMKNDPAFARTMAQQNPDMVKKLMLDDPEFAKIMARNNPDVVSDLMKNDPAFAQALRDKNPGIDALLVGRAPAPTNDRERLRALEEARRRQQLAQEAAQRQVQLTELQQKQLQALVAGMEGQSKAAFQAWNEVSNQQFVQGEWAKRDDEDKKKDENGKIIAVGREPGGPQPVAVMAGSPIKAGTILFAVLDTAVNSDEPGPVSATIVGGRFKGAKLLGTMSTSPIPGGGSPERITLNFNLMNIPEAPSSIGIQAIAVDPDTERTALASNVDRHYLLRYGAIFASAFMTGYAKVITSQGTVSQVATNGQTITTESPTLDSKKTIYAALGEVGKKWGDAVAPLANRPYTVTVNAGIGIGVLFLADVGG